MSEEACLFCDIVSGKEGAWVVYRDGRMMAILDPFPMTRGHTLIIPIRHYESIFDIPDPLLRRIISLAKLLCRTYESALDIQGVSIELLNHKLKRPKFRHFHLHVIPRYNQDDERDPANVRPSQTFPPASPKSLDRTLSSIRLKLAENAKTRLR